MIMKIYMEKNIQTVTFLIGNGFDIGALSALKSEYLTTYSQFYKYLETHCLNKDNLIYKSIFNIKGQVADLWSKDFEEVLHDAFKKKSKSNSVKNHEINSEKIESDYNEIRVMFLEFLNIVVLPKYLIAIYGKCGTEITGYLKDFPKYSEDNDISIYSDIRYNIFNFNYTTLVDNYFANYMSEFKNKLSIIHPHGTYYIPKTILFGVTDVEGGHPEQYPGKGNHRLQRKREEEVTRVIKHVDKSVDYEIKGYEKVIKGTDTFIVFGHSIGSSDKWWWKNIIEQLKCGSYLLLYWFDKDIIHEENDREKKLKTFF